jgi:hypothetical protein
LNRRETRLRHTANAVPTSIPRKTLQCAWSLLKRVGCSALKLGIVLIVRGTTAALATPVKKSRAAVVELVAQIQKADYAGDRARLELLYARLEPSLADEKLAAHVRYWRGFALWRRAINGFNVSADPMDLQHDLEQAITEFKESRAKDSGLVDAKIGIISCLSNLAYLARGDSAHLQELIAQSSSLVKEVKASDPDNPRFLWVLGPILWNIPAEHGGGQQRAIEGYEKGLEVARRARVATAQTLDPTWGEPELLMSLAWSNLNRTVPDLKSAEQSARRALALVPYWHYVRDILLPQIQNAEAATRAAAPGETSFATQGADGIQGGGAAGRDYRRQESGND